MKKKTILWVLCGVLLAAILFVPVLTDVYEDGGTRVYSALTYKIINWNRLEDETVYAKCRIYAFADRFRSTDELWEREIPLVPHTIKGVILEADEEQHTALLARDGDTANQFSFSTDDLEPLQPKVGDVLRLTYQGPVAESFPGKVKAIEWSYINDCRPIPYTRTFLDAATAKKEEQQPFGDVIISSIYGNCFFASSAVPFPWEIKINGSLSDHFCVGDRISVICDNIYSDNYDHIEADLESIDIEAFDMERRNEEDVCYKPVIYLYPQTETRVSVLLTPNGGLTCTYPAYKDGWTVSASPDGTLTDADGQTYRYLYWEGKTYADYDFSEGFCIKGKDTAAFLEDALEKLGLTREEANEFIIFWLPMMEQNPYNVISFQTDAYTDAAKLEITPSPDTLLRVFMTWYPSDKALSIPAQSLSAPEREGFTAVEWGGTMVSSDEPCPVR